MAHDYKIRTFIILLNSKDETNFILFVINFLG